MFGAEGALYRCLALPGGSAEGRAAAVAGLAAFGGPGCHLEGVRVPELHPRLYLHDPRGPSGGANEPPPRHSPSRLVLRFFGF